MIYYSDHGENLRTGHSPGDHDFVKACIPMFVYLDKEYQISNSENYRQLLSNKDAFFINDMVYNTLSGILDAESNFCDKREDMSSPGYGYQVEDLWTFARTVRVADDPMLKKEENQ